MNIPFAPMRCLLDKNVVRNIVAATRYRHERSLRPMEENALHFWRWATRQKMQIWLSSEEVNILKQYHYAEVVTFLRVTKVLYSGRYHIRWRRRIRETTGLTREDSSLLGLSTFGTDQSGSILGVDIFVTYDRPMINGFNEHHNALQQRLTAMTAQLPVPYNKATLPRILAPDQAIHL